MKISVKFVKLFTGYMYCVECKIREFEVWKKNTYVVFLPVCVLVILNLVSLFSPQNLSLFSNPPSTTAWQKWNPPSPPQYSPKGSNPSVRAANGWSTSSTAPSIRCQTRRPCRERGCFAWKNCRRRFRPCCFVSSAINLAISIFCRDALQLQNILKKSTGKEWNDFNESTCTLHGAKVLVQGWEILNNNKTHRRTWSRSVRVHHHTGNDQQRSTTINNEQQRTPTTSTTSTTTGSKNTTKSEHKKGGTTRAVQGKPHHDRAPTS